jgi:hypothetical protein
MLKPLSVIVLPNLSVSQSVALVPDFDGWIIGVDPAKKRSLPLSGGKLGAP